MLKEANVHGGYNLMAYSRLLLIAAGVLGIIAPQASAQEEGTDFDCSTYFASSESSEEFISFEQGSACARAAVNRQMLIHNIEVIPHVVANSLGIGPPQANPAGLADLSPGEFAARLAGGSGIIVSPVADAAPAPSTPWNAWGDGKYTWNDNGPSSFDLDGPLWNGLAGIDYKINSSTTIGLMGSYENSDLDGTGINLDSEGWGIGPYVGIMLTDNLVFSANFVGSRLTSSQFGGLFDFTSYRVQAAASLTGYWYSDTWRYSPGLSLSWSKEWLDENDGDLPDQTIETGLLTASMQVGDTLRLSDQTAVEPWAGAAFDYNFVNRTKTDGDGSVNDPYADLRLQAGLNFAFGSNAQLALTGEIGSLLRKDSATYAGEINFAYQF